MANKKKTIQKKNTKTLKPVVKKQAIKKKQTKLDERKNKAKNKYIASIAHLWKKLSSPIIRRVRNLMARRPHRSFRLTRRRDYKRSLKLPGYWSFTNHVRATLWKNWRLFGGVVLVYVVATIVVSGFGAQEGYSNLSDTLKSSSGDLFKGNFGSVGQAGLLLLSTVTSSLSPNLTQAQSVLGGLTVFFAWLTVIWLLRNVLAGHKPKIRDGIYNSGSPVLATVLVGFVAVLQLLPAAIAVIVFSAAQVSGLLEGGVSAMLIWSGVVLLSLLSLYWISSSFMALVVVTIPGMYPMQAIRAAGDLVIGRRLRILFRIFWLLFIIVVVWALVVIPIILFDDWIKTLVPAIKWLPLVPLTIIGMGSLTVLYVTSYIYLLYRRIVDDDAAPA
ncbi:MAG: hypothetical protein WAW80_00540, partial [Candidatus Saccharimonadales bacterium]